MTEQIYPLERVERTLKKRINARQFFEFTKDKPERYELIGGVIYMMASPSVSITVVKEEIYYNGTT
jgi:hypothetical protein